MGAEGPNEGVEQVPASSKSLSAPPPTQDWGGTGSWLAGDGGWGEYFCWVIKGKKNQFVDLVCPIDEF